MKAYPGRQDDWDGPMWGLVLGSYCDEDLDGKADNHSPFHRNPDRGRLILTEGIYNDC